MGTWNLNAKPPRGESLTPWLSFKGLNNPDIFVLGLQELVELSAKQVMSTSGEERLLWENLILRTLNKADRYVLLRSEQLVGACLGIFVKPELIPHISNVDVCVAKTGFSGMAGNKGGVSIRLDLYDSSFCFICAHFAAGQKNLDDRNRDYATITKETSFNQGWKIQDHE